MDPITRMDYWRITGISPTNPLGERTLVTALHSTPGPALARGCEAVLDGWTEVHTEGTDRTYKVHDAA
jgi:hypothetical protein